MEIGLISLILNISKSLFKPIKKIIRKTLILIHKRRENPIPIIKDENTVISLTGRKPLKVISYTNLKSKKIYIVSLLKYEGYKFDTEILLFEECGNTFITIWQSEPLIGNCTLEVKDIDSDGFNEILFGEADFGNSLGSKTIHLYSYEKNSLYTITEYYNFSATRKVYSPNVRIIPDDKSYLLECFQNFASKNGFFEKNDFDINNSKFSEQIWHIENNLKKSKKIKIRFYDGFPNQNASIGSSFENDSFKWTSYFKGSLFCYLKNENKHFVVFSPENHYNWVDKIKYVDGILCFKTRDTLSSFYCFINSDINGEIITVDKKNILIDEIDTISFNDKNLFINSQEIIL